MSIAHDTAAYEPAGEIVELRTTFSRRELAAACASRLVSGRLAACVQIDGPITSVYRWEGRVETGEEFSCTAKTSRDRAEACATAILDGHEYRTPQLVVSLVSASASYAAWVAESVAASRT